MSTIGTLSGQGGYGSPPQAEQPMTLGQPVYSHANASLGVPQQDRPYEDVGKLQLNLLGGNAILGPDQQPNQTGGLVTGLLGSVGGTFGQTGQEVGQAIGKVIEVPLGLGGNVLGAVGSIPIPFGTEIAGIIGAGYRAVTGEHEGDAAPTVISDLISPFQQQGGVSLGGLFQTSVGGLGLMGRAVERAYAGTRRAGDLPADIEAAIALGTITREEGVDQAVARGQGFSNDAAHNILWSILLDPLTWLSLGVGGVAKAAGAGVKISRAAEINKLIAVGSDIAPNAARLLRLEGKVTDTMMAAAELKKLGPLERLSLNTIGRMPGFNEVLVPVSNQVIRLTDPLRLFSGGKIGVRTAEVVATSATAGTATAFGLDTVHHVGSIIDGLVTGGRAQVNRGIGVLTTNFLYRYAADDLAHEFAKAGHIPGIDGEAGRAMNPTVFMRGVFERSPLDASVGSDIEVMAEKLMPFDSFAKEADRTADTAKRLAYATNADESSVIGKLKGTFKEWALSHALSYVEASRKLVEEVRPALAAMADLPDEFADASRYTLVANDTLTVNRWAKISAMVEDGKDLDAIREEVGRYADFNWLNADQLDAGELLDGLRRWGAENADGLLKEVDVYLPNSSVLRGDLPAPLKTWLDGVEPMGYRLTLMPPEGAERAMWRVTRDADGKIININPFIEFQTEAQMMKDPRWFQRLMSQGFRQIRTERILWTMRRRFVTSMAQDGRMTPHAAEGIYKSIMYSANERGMTPRALKPFEIMEAAKRALKTEQVKGNVGLGTMSELELTKRLVVAFEGDLSLVGLTQKLTGKAKVKLPGASENVWGQIAERLYPMARFSLNHFFMVQEIVEPYILNIMRGIPVPLNKHSEGFERAVAMRNAMDNLVRSDLTPEGVMMEMAEYQRIIQAGMQQAHTFYGSGTRLGRSIGGMWGQTASRKAAAEGLMAMRVTGDLMKDTFTQMRGPEFWHELELLYTTTDTAVIAERWLAQAFYMADGNGDRITEFMDIIKPENIGPATRVFKGKGPGVRWHHVAGLMGMTDEGADEVLLKSLKDGNLIDTSVFAPVEGAMTYAQWMRKATDAGMDEKFADRAYKMATGPEVEEFWAGWHDVMAGTTATKEVKDQSTRAIRGITQARARVMGVTEEEFIKMHYAAPPGFSQEGAIAGADALFQSVDNIAHVIVERHGAPPGVEYVNRRSLLGAIREDRERFPRAGQGATGLDELTEKIRTKGFKPTEPIILWYDPRTHSVTVGDGNTRMAAAARLNLENVPVQVKILPSEGAHVGTYMPVPGVAKEGLVADTFVAPSSIGFTPVGKTNSLHAVLDGLPEEGVADPSTVFQSRIGAMLLERDTVGVEKAARDARIAARAAGEPVIPAAAPPLPAHEVMGAIAPEEAGHHYFNEIAVNDPDRLRALLPELSGEDANWVKKVLDRVKTMKERPKFVFKSADGKPYYVGNAEPQDLVDMAVEWMPVAEGLAAKDWYLNLREGIKNLFGESNADTVLRMFSVSQANASPINGMMNVLRALEQSFALGFEKGSIGQREFLTAATRKVQIAGGVAPKTAQLNAENIVKAMLDLPIDRNYAAKLNDFTDSVLGNSTRRWTGRASRNMPVAVDRHTARDVGFMDQKVLTHLAESPYATHLPNGVVVVRDSNEQVVVTMREDITTSMKRDPKTKEMKEVSEARWNLVDSEGNYVDRKGNMAKKPVAALDMDGALDNLQYEHGVDVINKATVLFNNYVDKKTGIQGVYGRTDWRPEEVQAVGWMRVQKTFGGAEESPNDTLIAHHYPVAYEVSAEEGSPWARAAPMFEDMADLDRKKMIDNLDVMFAQWAREKLGANITSAGFVGDARWAGGYRTYSAPGMVMGTAEMADDMADIRALIFRQKEVWAYHPSSISSFVRATGANDAAAHYAAVDILIPLKKHGDTDAADDIVHRIQDALDAPGITVFPDGIGNLRLRVVDRPLNPKTYELDTNFFFFKQHQADGAYDDGTKFRAGMADRQDVEARLKAAYAKAEIDPDALGVDHVLHHGTVYIAGPRKRIAAAGAQMAYDAGDAVPPSSHMWETHLEDTLANLRGRGRTVDEGSLGDLQSQINTALDGHLRKASPQRYNDVAAGGTVLHDRRTAGILGYTRRISDGRVIVGATQRANVTTGLHELAHVFATDLDESARALIQRARLTAIGAQRTDLDARVAALDLKIAGARSRTTKAKYRAEKNVLVNDLGELVDEAAWGPQHEEWFADEFNRWVKNGRVENRELQGAFEHFRNWLSEVWDTIRGHKVDQPSPEMEELFNSLFDNRVATVPYDLDQGALMLAGKQKVRQGMDNAATTQYFKKGRSFVERSINHPFVGMYPASYYWGKILPEMIKFLALRPFGMKTPFLAWNVLREVSDTVRMQQALDPSITQWLKDNEEGIMTMNMLFPAVPNDIPVNAPLWARRIAEQGLENADRVAQGQAAKPVDYMKGLADSAAWVFGPYSSLQRAGSVLGSLGDLGRMGVKNVTGVDLTTGARPASAVSEAINPFTGRPFTSAQ